MSVVGATYYERGQRVRIICQWRTGHGPGGPKNVLIERHDGTRAVRPFRGLRKNPPKNPGRALEAGGRDPAS